MRCRDCSQFFCDYNDAEDSVDRDKCRKSCMTDPFFCKGKPKVHSCLDECVAECMCPRYCFPLAFDAGLCVEQGGRWINFNQNFNNIIVGTISLIEISTTEGWVALMHQGIDFVGPMREPVRDNQELMGFFFVAYILIGSFFIMNLCVGVIIDNYSKEKENREKKGESVMLTEAQAKWVSGQKALYMRKQFFAQTNLHTLSPTRRHLIDIVSNPVFENGIMACIILNTLAQAMMQHPSPPSPYNYILDQANVFFAIVFNFELVLKLAAMQKNYFTESWNLFDFFCVLVTDVFFLIEAIFSDFKMGMVMNSIRIFRIARLFRLVRFLHGLNQLFTAFILSIPKLVNVGVVLCLFLYLYAVLGVNLFALTRFMPMNAHTEQANFRDFVQAFSALLRSMTGEGWNEIMHDLSKDKFFFESYLEIPCISSVTITSENYVTFGLENATMTDQGYKAWEGVQCGNSTFAVIYFITYAIIMSIVILNLFIAVIFEGFDESQKSELSEIIRKCIEVWRKYDPSATMMIPLGHTFDFIDEVIIKLYKGHLKEVDLRALIEENDRRSPAALWMKDDPGEDGGAIGWYNYNLQFMRMLDLRVTSDNQVRFVAAVRSVIRRVVVQGGIGSQRVSKSERVKHLEMLEDFDSMLTKVSERKPEHEMLATLEKRQRLAIARSAGPHSGCLLDMRRDLLLTEQVAAAKIQQRFKELFQRKRARAREGIRPADPGASGGGNFNRERGYSYGGSAPLVEDYGPIARAAG